MNLKIKTSESSKKNSLKIRFCPKSNNRFEYDRLASIRNIQIDRKTSRHLR